MPSSWTETAASYLTSTTSCPRCDSALAGPGSCPTCGAQLAGAEGTALWQASLAAAEALRHRQKLIDGLPVVSPKLSAAELSAPATAAIASLATPVAPALADPTERASSQLSVQSVLAVAGAGLFAVAAIVFTFFNPDLTDFDTRTAIIAGISAIFMGGAWLLAWRGLTFSAEAVGALGAVFLALDVWAFSQSSPAGVNEFTFAGIGMLVAAVALLALAALVRLRTWLWSGLVLLALAPAPLAYGLDTEWAAVLGSLGVAAFALVAHAVARRFAPRFHSELRADHRTLTVLQLLVLPVAAAQLVIVDVPTSPGRVWITSGLLAAFAVLAWLARRNPLPRFWAYAAGALITTAVALVPLVADLDNESWHLAAITAAAAGAVVLIALVRGSSPLHAGSWTVLLAVALPSVSLAGLSALAVAVGTSIAGSDPVPQLAAVIGLAAATVGTAFLAWRRSSVLHFAVALWLVSLALVTFAMWSAFALPVRIVALLVLAVGLAAIVFVVVRRGPIAVALRVPLAVASHVALVLVAIISWPDTSLRVAAGAAAVAGLFAAARTVPARVRPVHVAIGYAYALAIVAAAFDLLGFETIAVLCLTTTVGALTALVVTLVPWFKAGSWYAILAVTAVPFAIGIVSVFIERSGWTALSTGVTFALLLAILLTKRPGLTLLIRAGAAALLVPALAVVIICLGAQVLAVSASPITLPMIAVIVACTLPAAGLIAAAVQTRGVSEGDARVVRVWIEVSALFTGAVAVILGLAREAAGVPTTFLVLVLLGIGAVATAIFGKRRYGWPVAITAFTGALWCVWWLAGITALEPYLLPPALTTAVIAAILVARNRPGFGLSAIGLFWTGLAVAAAPVLVVLALSGSGEDAALPWRSLGLLASALVLIVLAAVLAKFERLRPLRTPLLVVAVGVASAGAIQGVRYGLGLDAVDVATPDLVMLPTLGFAVAATVLAAVAGRLLALRSRWLYAPAVLYLVVGPIATIRDGWFPIIAVLVLSLVLLALMIVTTVIARTRPVTLPPVWFTFAVAWCTAVASWSQRELRVEAFSLPLGLALLTVGIITMRSTPDTPDARRSLNSWPIGYSGSWRLLAPGIVVTLLPSILATGTDPRTERAILVIALALIAILIGSLKRLAAPFILGIIALPIENVVVFAVQIGRNIGALPWWITLATAGAVLLVIAVGSERRSGRGQGAAARLRDLT